MSEKDLISWIHSRLIPSEDVLVHSGDDLAVLCMPDGARIAFGIDSITAGVDFVGSGYENATPPELAGRKAIAVNLSDLAAMGARPVACVAAVSAPSGTGQDYLQRLYQGMKEIAGRLGMPIVGGDVTAAEGSVAITIAVLGSYDEGDTVLLRSAARPGDLLAVTGSLGGSIRGRHLEFEPALEVGRWLAKSGVRTACIDISDGLSTDATHIAEQSGVRVVLSETLIPVSEAAVGLSEQDGRPPLEHALNDGEDFELLFTVPGGEEGRRILENLPESVPVPVVIGRIEAGPAEVLLETTGGTSTLAPGGFEHQL